MKISIMPEWNINYWVCYSKKWAEIITITETGYEKITNWTHILKKVKWKWELKTKKIPKEELEKQEELKKLQEEEKKIEKTTNLLIKKQALEFLWKDTKEIEELLTKIK